MLLFYFLPLPMMWGRFDIHKKPCKVATYKASVCGAVENIALNVYPATCKCNMQLRLP